MWVIYNTIWLSRYIKHIIKVEWDSILLIWNVGLYDYHTLPDSSQFTLQVKCAHTLIQWTYCRGSQVCRAGTTFTWGFLFSFIFTLNLLFWLIGLLSCKYFAPRISVGHCCACLYGNCKSFLGVRPRVGSWRWKFLFKINLYCIWQRDKLWSL